MFAQDEAAREAHERREAQHAVMKRAMANPQPIATLYDLDKARMAASSADALAKAADIPDISHLSPKELHELSRWASVMLEAETHIRHVLPKLSPESQRKVLARVVDGLASRAAAEKAAARGPHFALAKRAGAAGEGTTFADDEEAEYYADGTLKRVRKGTIEKAYYPNGTLKHVRLLDESELAGAR